MGRFEIARAPNGSFFFRLRAKSGDVLLTGETYLAKQSCVASITRVKVSAPYLERYEERLNDMGEVYFVLKAANGEVIGRGEATRAIDALKKAIEAVREHATGAAVLDPA